ncbi:CARDB protein [Anaerovirgula multivorans]|uniref:CARDB protein n=1 Tax=Anaerovirgula multivorans TaxID=312168 RepID=A0A239HP94_9FIRM|nr:CARDB domain-containing protein [Anaerovirgula multivorans]SNS83021.1 CARDB protein [Anaerovirgula multivorans]
MKKFKVIAVFSILVLIITGFSYALQHDVSVFEMDDNIIFTDTNSYEENNIDPNTIKITGPTIKIEEPIDKLTNELSVKSIIVSDNSLTEDITVTDSVYKSTSMSTSSTLPDLNITNLREKPGVTYPFKVGETAYFEYTIANHGGTSTPWNTKVGIYYNTIHVGTITVGTIQAGYTYTGGISLDGIPEGTHEIKVKADPFNEISESNENNNEDKGNFTWQGVPDLNVSSFKTVSNARDFEIEKGVDFIFTISNEGTGRANGSIPIHLHLFGTEIYTSSIPSLDVGYTATGRFTLTFAEGGYYSLAIHANKNNSIVPKETNLTNNLKTTAVSIIDSSFYKSCGWPTSVIPIRPYSYNSTWQTPMDTAISNWNNDEAKITFNKVSLSDNTVAAGQYDYDAYGKCFSTYKGDELTKFEIQLNSRTISEDATNLSNFIQSVFVHELGHTIWLADNPNTTSSSIMKYSRNRNTMTKPQTYDIIHVKAKY